MPGNVSAHICASLCRQECDTTCNTLQHAATLYRQECDKLQSFEAREKALDLPAAALRTLIVALGGASAVAELTGERCSRGEMMVMVDMVWR